MVRTYTCTAQIQLWAPKDSLLDGVACITLPRGRHRLGSRESPMQRQHRPIACHAHAWHVMLRAGSSRKIDGVGREGLVCRVACPRRPPRCPHSPERRMIECRAHELLAGQRSADPISETGAFNTLKEVDQGRDAARRLAALRLPGKRATQRQSGANPPVTAKTGAGAGAGAGADGCQTLWQGARHGRARPCQRRRPGRTRSPHFASTRIRLAAARADPLGQRRSSRRDASSPDTPVPPSGSRPPPHVSPSRRNSFSRGTPSRSAGSRPPPHPSPSRNSLSRGTPSHSAGVRRQLHPSASPSPGQQRPLPTRLLAPRRSKRRAP